MLFSYSAGLWRHKHCKGGGFPRSHLLRRMWTWMQSWRAEPRSHSGKCQTSWGAEEDSNEGVPIKICAAWENSVMTTDFIEQAVTGKLLSGFFQWRLLSTVRKTSEIFLFNLENKNENIRNVEKTGKAWNILFLIKFVWIRFILIGMSRYFLDSSVCVPIQEFIVFIICIQMIKILEIFLWITGSRKIFCAPKSF